MNASDGLFSATELETFLIDELVYLSEDKVKGLLVLGNLQFKPDKFQ